MKEGYINISIHTLLLSIVCIFAFFINNQTIIPDIMESRNIITAREMVYDGHWMIPTMNGELRLEKPPLPTWIAAGVEKFLPDSIGAQRAMAGLAASVLVFFFYLFGRKLTQNEDFAWISSLILCTSYSVVLMGRTASWDIYCHAFMMAAIYYIYSAFKDSKGFRSSAVLAGIFLGLSFMSKGPVSFFALLLPFLIVFFIYETPFQKHRIRELLTMIVLCIIIGGWWYVYIYIFHPDVSSYVFHKESSAWVGHNVRPWYYYWTFFLETGVWALLLLSAMAFTFRQKAVKMKREYLLVLTWLIIQLVLLSLFPEKKKRYLLPAMIPCAYLIGFLFTYWKEQLYEKRKDEAVVLYKTNAYLIAFVCLSLPVFAYIFAFHPGYIPIKPFLIFSILVIIVSGWLLICSWHKEPFYFVYGIVALFMIGEIFAMPYIGSLVNNNEFKSISRTQDIHSLDKLPFYYVKGQGLRIELVYEAHRKIRPLDVSNSDSLMKALPLAILTHNKVEKELPASVLNKVKTKWIDRYDDNRRPKGTRRYNDEFIYNVTILEKK
jgi:4-amino-4-deoxy-L-arabinose transferase-like glycosyltransferase